MKSGNIKINKARLITILLIFLVLIIIIVLITSKKDNSIENSSGERVVVEDSKIELEKTKERFEKIMDTLINKGYIKKEDIRSNDKLKDNFGLSEVGKYEGIIAINEEDESNYTEVALIVPEDTSKNDSILVKMISHYEAVKSNYPKSVYLREPKFVCMKQQAGVSIFIVSQNFDAIYNIINSNQ